MKKNNRRGIFPRFFLISYSLIRTNKRIENESIFEAFTKIIGMLPIKMQEP